MKITDIRTLSLSRTHWAWFEEPVEDGHLILPDAPGFGVELADDLETRFPYIEGSWGNPVQR